MSASDPGAHHPAAVGAPWAKRQLPGVQETSPVAVAALLLDKPPPSPSLAALKHLEELHSQLAALQAGEAPYGAARAVEQALPKPEFAP